MLMFYLIKHEGFILFLFKGRLTEAKLCNIKVTQFTPAAHLYGHYAPKQPYYGDNIAHTFFPSQPGYKEHIRVLSSCSSMRQNNCILALAISTIPLQSSPLV